MAGHRQWLPILVLLIIPSVEAAERSPWSFGIGGSWLTDDNITRASRSPDILEDTILSLKADGRYALDITDDHAIVFNGFFRAEEYQDYDGVSNQQAGMEVEYRFRTRAGFGAPVYSFYVNGFQADYDTDNRDGNTLEYGFRFRKRFTDRIAVAAGAALSERTADGEVFDLEQTRYFGHLDYSLSGSVQAYLAYYFIDGDTYSISSTAPAGNWSDYGDAYEWDPAFSMNQPRWAYRVDAETGVTRLGLNIGINRKNAVDLSVDWVDSEASGYDGYNNNWNSPGYGSGDSVTYDVMIVALSYFLRF